MIIFDLDDTLIDTSGSITPIRIQDIVHYFIKKGLVSSFESSYLEFLEINRNALNITDALKIFVKDRDGESGLIEEAKEIYNRPELEMVVQTLPSANQILNQLKVKYSLALLTYGNEQMQLKKLEKAGIDRAIFSKIVVCPERDKKPYYQEILKHFGEDPKDVIACGDRVVYDLVPAKELGCHTIHVKWGRGRLSHNLDKFVDKQVENLEECYRAIETGF